jgi:hypothetical protein
MNKGSIHSFLSAISGRTGCRGTLPRLPTVRGFCAHAAAWPLMKEFPHG